MQQMVALNIHSRNALMGVLDALIRGSNRSNEHFVSKLYHEQVHRLFNYGMNACADSGLVKNCLVELFLLVQDRSELVRVGRSVDSNLFRLFRRLLMQHMIAKRTWSISDTLEKFFSKENTLAGRDITSLQREALFLKFDCKLTYDEIGTVMNLSIERVCSQISKAVDVLTSSNGRMSQAAS